MLDAWVTRQVLRCADALIAHSAGEVESLRSMFPGTPAAKCFHPAYEAFQPTEERETLRTRLGLCAPTLLFFGFVRPYKRLDLALRALSQLKGSIAGIQLLVVGEFRKDTRADAKRLVRELKLEPSVRIVDRYVESCQVANYFVASDLLVLPYDLVTGSGVLQIASGLGMPAVATRVGGFPEMIEEGVNGLLAAPGDARSLAQAIKEALEPKRLALLREGARNSKARFSWDGLVDAVEALAGYCSQAPAGNG
jgi:glycosyltransferase involved in cell wall biosynthesis